jgi:hypothetical protein
MQRMSWITHRQRRIFLVDYSEMRDPEAIIELARGSAAEIQKAPHGSVLCLLDVQGARYTPAVISVFKEAALANKPHLRASAVTGISGLLMVAYRGITRLMRQEIPAYQTRAEALEWLSAQAE